MYLYRAVDSAGNTLDFLLRATRDAQAAKRFFSKTLAAPHTVPPRVITVDKNAAYPKAFNQLQEDGILCWLLGSSVQKNRLSGDSDGGYVLVLGDRYSPRYSPVEKFNSHPVCLSSVEDKHGVRDFILRGEILSKR